VVDFLMAHEKLSYPNAIRYLGKKYNIEVDDVPLNYTPPPPRPLPPPLPTLVLPRSMVAKRMRDLSTDNLVKYIMNDVQWGNEQRARIPHVLHDYCVGHSTIRQLTGDHEFTVFWQIDKDCNPRTAHYMKYKPDGHRIKEKNQYPTDWMHNLLERGGYKKYYDPEKQEYRQCLFGEHLLKRYPKATIKLVESEKTALLMAIAYGNHAQQVWMACGGLSLLSRERLKPIIDRGRQVILYPDRDGIEKWRVKAEQMHYDRLTIDTEPVTKWWQPEDGEKADIADVVLRYINNSKPMKDIKEVADKMPAIQPLINSLKLEVENE
jgi:hypothetical protein